MQIDVREAATHRKLGLAYLKSGNRERARRHLTTAVELDADDAAARKLLDEVKSPVRL